MILLFNAVEGYYSVSAKTLSDSPGYVSLKAGHGILFTRSPESMGEGAMPHGLNVILTPVKVIRRLVIYYCN